MFGVDSIELMIIAVAALLFIGPKDLPRVMMSIGRFVGKVRGHARHFTAGIENMMREAELEEMEKKWREENQRILTQYPTDAFYPDPASSVPGSTEGLPDIFISFFDNFKNSSGSYINISLFLLLSEFL